MNNKALKLDGKKVVFREGKGKALLLFLVPFLSVFVLMALEFYSVQYFPANSNAWPDNLAAIISIFVTLVTIGINWTLLEMFREEKRMIAASSDPFRIFQRGVFWKVFGLYLVKNIFIALWTILLIVPGFVKAYAYSQAELILFDELRQGEYSGLTGAITKSRQMMQGHKGSRFYLDLSFLGWFILTGITMGILSFYVLPYYNATTVAFYEKLLENGHH